MTYVGGKVTTFDNLRFDCDLGHINKLISSLGHQDVFKLHYLTPSKDFSTGLQLLYDWSFDDFLVKLNEFKELHVFCEHELLLDMLFENTPILPLLTDNQISEYDCEVVDMPKNTRSGECVRANRGKKRNNVVSIVADDDEFEYDSDKDDCEVMTGRKMKKVAEQEDEAYRMEMDELFNGWGDNVECNEIDYSSTDGMHSPNRSDDEQVEKVKQRRGDSFRRNTKPEDVKFFVGQEFENAMQFKEALESFAISNGREFEYTKNHCDKVGAKCKIEGCTWRIWASWLGKTGMFQVKTYSGDHICGRVDYVKKMKPSWIARQYIGRFRVNPYWPLKEMVETIWLDWGIQVTMWRCYKARLKAQSLVLGQYKEQYSLLGNYASEILQLNSNNTVKLELENGVFKKIYICFHALKQGFIDGCRPFIGLDGCFLKGPYGGQLLTAVGRDGNNQMFPVAWAVVDVEDTKCWTWFLKLLFTDLGSTRGAGYTVMSDQQKGLLAAITSIWLEAEKRCCAWHVYTNFRGEFGSGHEFKLAFWRVAKSTTQSQYLEAVKEFMELDLEAAEDVVARNPLKWCTANFNCYSQCDSLDNNMCEAFNSYILGSRHKPIISMLEDISDSLMTRHHKKRDEIMKKDVLICPRIQLKLEKNKENARGWIAKWNGAHEYGVRFGASQEKFVVDLSKAECGCRSWQLSGIPCLHAVAAIWMRRKEKPEFYVSECYSKQHFLKAYAFTMNHANGRKEWPTGLSVEPPILPPIAAHRPKKKRRRPTTEEARNKPKISKVGAVMTCTNCRQPDHNSRTCTNPQQPKPQRKKQKTTTSKGGKAKKRSKRQVVVVNCNLNLMSTPPRGPTPRPPAMHNRGLGLYTYPNGFQAVGRLHAPSRREVAYVTDDGGTQRINSMTPAYAPIIHSSSSSTIARQSAFGSSTQPDNLTSQAKQPKIAFGATSFSSQANP